MNDELSEGKEFLGAGIAFPLDKDPAGLITMKSLEDQVSQSIQLILRTAKGERVMHPDFGAGLNRLVFEPLNQATISLAQHYVKDALVRFEPRVEVLNVSIRVDPQLQDQLLINVEYRLRTTDATFNLVYPFYLKRGGM
jgi:phage baseplate assembly protein W